VTIIGFVRIENFRSIRLLELNGIDTYVPVMGLNSTGKSNILRALNLFFNGVIDEEHKQVSLDHDLSSFAPAGKKKRIAVTVGLRLSEDFDVPRQGDFKAAHGIGDVIYIRRSWSLSPGSQALVDEFEFGTDPTSLQFANDAERANVLAFVRAVRFTYVSNHSRPSEVIRAELEPLRATLVQRLRASQVYKEAPIESVIEELDRLGQRMFGDVVTSLSAGIPGLTVAPELPKDFADLVFSVGLQAFTAGGKPRDPEYEGSGAQSFMLLHVLDLADRTRRRGGFGWVQGAVWALEEPESFLHAGLRAKFASDLVRLAADRKRQVFLTTHQDEFARVAERVVLTTRSAEGTAVEVRETRDALVESTRQLISGYVHPLMVHVDSPLVLVEGTIDELYLRRAFVELGLRPSWKLLSPDSALGDGTGGDALLTYLKGNASALRARPVASPVIVLRDWEDSRLKQFEAALAPHPFSTCLRAPAELSNPELGESFLGIERYLPTALIRSVVVEGLGLETLNDNSPLSVRREALEMAKPRLAQRVRQGESVGGAMHRLARWLDDQVVKVISQVPPDEFL